MADETAFYTKNGTYLGIAFQKLNLSMDLYPCVGLRTLGEHVTVNFGQDPFIFDIVHYIKVIIPFFSLLLLLSLPFFFLKKNAHQLIVVFIMYRSEKMKYSIKS